MTESDLPRTQINGERHYIVGGDPVPSVTTVCGWHPRKKKALAKWEDRVGSESAERIRDEAALMGTLTHHRILQPYAMRPLPSPEVDLDLAYDGIQADIETCEVMWDDLDFDVGSSPYVEQRIVEHDHGYAGTFDLLTDGGVVADLKTSKAVRASHRWQIAAYYFAAQKDSDLPNPEKAAIIRLDPRPESNPTLTADVEWLDQDELAYHFDTFTDLLSKYGPQA